MIASSRLCGWLFVFVFAGLGMCALAVRIADGPKLAKLSPAPGEDGAPPDPQTEALVDELNDTIEEGPDQGQSFEEWEAEIGSLVDELSTTPTSCETFAPPRRGECSLAGNKKECGAPCVYSEPNHNIDALPFNDAEDNYDLVYSIASTSERVDWEAVDLMTYAWAFLLDNIDIVRWDACRVYGHAAGGGLFGFSFTTAQCLSDKIEGKAPDATVQFTHESGNGAFWTTANAIDGGTIHVPIDGSVWNSSYLDKFKAASPGSAEQFCIVADLAATIAHELTHSCMTSGNRDNGTSGTDDPNVCSTSYLLENNLRWAFGQRYPSLLATADCGYYGDSRMWRNDGVAYPGDAPF